MFELK
jgi:WD40 repeat protein